MKDQVWLIYGLLLFHGLVTGITVAGCIALLTGRFTRFHKKDFFAWAFLLCSVGQLISLFFTGGCILTDWEKRVRQRVDPDATYAKTFLQEYLPFLPDGFIDSIPFITVGGLTGAIIQIVYATRRSRRMASEHET
ncbi:MAG: hypothetical protein ACFCUI_05265 [Bernardetiaceae bacterium]